MEWTEEGVVISVRGHGETSAIAELFTREHGRHLGLVRGGRSRRMRPVLQPGNTVLASWRARLSEHLGTYNIEPVRARAGAVMEDGLRLSGLTALVSLPQLVPEREPHGRVHDAFVQVLDEIAGGDHWPALLVRFELGMLEELGFGLDLSRCAATGARDDLIYVSPKSGRAVSAEAGQPYAEKLLTLPGFLAGDAGVEPQREDILAGFELTGFFLERDVWRPRDMEPPAGRARLIARLARDKASR